MIQGQEEVLSDPVGIINDETYWPGWLGSMYLLFYILHKYTKDSYSCTLVLVSMLAICSAMLVQLLVQHV